MNRHDIRIVVLSEMYRQLLDGLTLNMAQTFIHASLMMNYYNFSGSLTIAIKSKFYCV